MTARASAKLFAVADTPPAILALEEEELAGLIKDCGLYNMKARNIRKLCQALLDRHGGIVPDNRTELEALPGVGRKSTDILLQIVFNKPVVAVDTHVHRVCNRLGLAVGKTEAQTARSSNLAFLLGVGRTHLAVGSRQAGLQVAQTTL